MFEIILILVRNLTVLHCSATGDVGLEGEVVLGECPGVDDLTAQVLSCKGLKLISRDDEVWERV